MTSRRLQILGSRRPRPLRPPASTAYNRGPFAHRPLEPSILLGVPKPLRARSLLTLLAVSATLAARPALAVLDIEDRGPVLSAGGFALRVTNAGILGNAFLDKGLSADPSFEIRPGSGYEALNHCQLWVGGRTEGGALRVSGGPLLEWRPTLDPDDRVRVVEQGRPGSVRLFDDDGDGATDEEQLDGVDQDGDGEIDEDLGIFAQQMMSARFVDDRPEALYYVYEGGENHVPLHLTVEQEAYAWSATGHEGIAGLSFKITNHGARPIEDVRLGFLADLDSRERNDRRGHLDDRIEMHGYSRSVFEGISCVSTGGYPAPPCDSVMTCFSSHARTLPTLRDTDPDAGLPHVAIVPLLHTTDPLAHIPVASRHARAPAAIAFRSSVFARGRIPGQGGLPTTDLERYEALQGTFATAATNTADDYVVLVSCGPFPTLGPGQSLDFHLALVATLDPDSLETLMGNAAELQHGRSVNLLPDTTDSRYPDEWYLGQSGRVGHEVCIEPPAGVTFVHDPHCAAKFDPLLNVPEMPEVYAPGRCIWTDADCDLCTGVGGRETRLHWLDPGQRPVHPRVRLVPGDHAMRVEWDNRAEVLAAAGLGGPVLARFGGYRIYRTADWRGRRSLLPDQNRWAMVAALGPDTLLGHLPLASVVDSTVDYERVLYEMRLYPPGRYAFVDSAVHNGFDYAYVVTSLLLLDVDVNGFRRTVEFESPFTPEFAEVVRPRSEARAAGGAWVTPNPFRARAAWDRPPVVGDQLTRHVDFMGLPRARCTIKIWTVSGDHVATLDHDGSGGDGQAPWDLVSRNGQEVESGIYLFTIDSPIGQQTGRFVIIR